MSLTMFRTHQVKLWKCRISGASSRDGEQLTLLGSWCCAAGRSSSDEIYSKAHPRWPVLIRESTMVQHDYVLLMTFYEYLWVIIFGMNMSKA